MRPIMTGHRLTLVDFCHWLVLTFDRGLRQFCSSLSQDMHVHVHVWMFLMRWFYFSEGWLDSILNKRLGHPIHRAKRAQVITNLKHKVWNQREAKNLAHLFFSKKRDKHSEWESLEETKRNEKNLELKEHATVPSIAPDFKHNIV